MKILFKNNTYNNAFYNNCSKIIFFGARKQELNRDTVSFSFKSKEMSKEEKEALVVEAIKKQNPKKNSEIEQALQKQEVDLIASEDSKVFSRCLSLLSKNTPYEIVRLISKLDDKKYADVNSLLDADFSPYEAVKIASLDAEKRKKVDFLFEKGLKQGVSRFALYDENRYQKVLRLIDSGVLDDVYLDFISGVPDSYYDKVLVLLKRGFTSGSAVDVVGKAKNYFDVYLKLIDKGISSDDALKISTLGFDEFIDKASFLVLNGVFVENAIDMCELNDEEYERFAPFLSTLGRFAKNINSKGLPKIHRIDLFKKLNESYSFDGEKFSDWVDNINYEKLKKIAPDMKDFTFEQYLQFADAYHNLPVSMLDKKHLSYPENFTHFLSETYITSSKLDKILTINPATNRVVGKLPQKWSENLSEEEKKNLINRISDEIIEFKKKECGYFDKEEYHDEFAKRLGAILKKKVEVTYCNQGTYGIVYKVDVEGAKPVCLKLFFSDFGCPHYKHGGHIEPQTALFANAHSHDFVKMYFGKVGGNNQDDTFIVTQFLEKGIAPEKTNVINNDYQVISVDVETNSEYNFIRNGHNTINGKIIDFGEVYIVNNSTGEAE